MNWLNFYKNEYLKELEVINGMRKSNTEENLLCSEYVKMFECACNLLKLYLHYNGLFQFENREIIKEAFYVELINDGEKWINALSLAEMFSHGDNNFNKLILSYCEDENFVIYENLKNTFKSFAEDYE